MKKLIFTTVILLVGATGVFAKGVDPEEKVEYYLYDHLGGVDAVMDEQGNVVERRDYLPYGEERVRVPSAENGERHGFTGKELDGESGLYYYGARHYDPALGRFASLDPLTLGESAKPLQSVLSNPQILNGYSYALNNPLRYNDPTGMIPKNSSLISKLVSVFTFEGFGSGKGWLASSARDFSNNPNKETFNVMANRGVEAVSRFLRSPASLADETWDQKTNERIQTLDCRLQIPATDYINQVESEEKSQLRITDALRTFEEQDEIYAQGRTKPGPVVTFAKGGESFHNYGLAFDAVEMVGGKVSYSRFNNRTTTIAKNLGFEWGGDWPSPKTDNPHFQMTFGQTIEKPLGKAKK